MIDLEYTETHDPIIQGEFWLSTTDNPYDPFTEYESWLSFDEQKGYNTNGLLARMALTSDELTDEENELAISHAVSDILNLFPGMFKIVRREE